MRKSYTYLRQGDILRKNVGGDLKWEYVVVLTADCDIWNDKFGNYLTVIPLLTVNEYIENLYSAEQCQNEIDKICESFCSMSDFDIDEHFFHEYIFSTDVSVVEKRYGKVATIAALPFLQKFKRGELAPVDALKAVCLTKNVKWDRKLRQSLTSLKLEYFFLNDIPGGSDLGYVALLRLPQSISVDTVAFSRDDQISEADSYSVRKVGSLSDGIRFALAQAFANVFSRIGMPTSFESDKEQIIELICERYS